MYVLHCENLMTLLADLGYEETENAFKYVIHRLIEYGEVDCTSVRAAAVTRRQRMLSSTYSID